MTRRHSLLALAVSAALGAAPSHALPTRYQVATGSNVSFKAASNLHGFHGGTDELTGFVVFDPSTPLDSSGEIIIDADTLRSGDGKRDGKMRGQALETKIFPEIKIRMRRFAADPSDGSGKLTGNIHGELELHGVKRNLMIPATVETRGEKLHVEGVVGFDMRDWSIHPPRTKILFATLRVLPNVSVNFELDLEPMPEAGDVSPEDHDPEAAATRLKAMAAALRARQD